MGSMFLVIIDTHSKWLDIYKLNSANTMAIVEKLHTLFAMHWILEVLVSDDGSVFTSLEFTKFMKPNGIWHIKTAPLSPGIKWASGESSPDVKGWVEKTASGLIRDETLKVVI